MVLEDKRYHQATACLHAERAQAVLVKARTSERFLQALCASRTQRRTCRRVAQRHMLAKQAGWQLAGARGNHQPAALHQLDHEQARIDQGATALGDQLEDHVQIGLSADRPCDLGGRVERRHGPLQLVAMLARAGIATRVVDRKASKLGEHRDGLLVRLA